MRIQYNKDDSLKVTISDNDIKYWIKDIRMLEDEDNSKDVQVNSFFKEHKKKLKRIVLEAVKEGIYDKLGEYGYEELREFMYKKKAVINQSE